MNKQRSDYEQLPENLSRVIFVNRWWYPQAWDSRRETYSCFRNEQNELIKFATSQEAKDYIEGEGYSVLNIP